MAIFQEILIFTPNLIFFSDKTKTHTTTGPEYQTIGFVQFYTFRLHPSLQQMQSISM